jgi:hypothetical protein
VSCEAESLACSAALAAATSIIECPDQFLAIGLEDLFLLLKEAFLQEEKKIGFFWVMGNRLDKSSGDQVIRTIVYLILFFQERQLRDSNIT